mgnify:CR=1 FL=1
MKTKALVKIAQQLIDNVKKEQIDEIESLKVILKELKKKKRLLKEKLENEKDTDKCLDIQRKLDVLSSQRKKGLSLIKKLNKTES